VLGVRDVDDAYIYQPFQLMPPPLSQRVNIESEYTKTIFIKFYQIQLKKGSRKLITHYFKRYDYSILLYIMG